MKGKKALSPFVLLSKVAGPVTAAKAGRWSDPNLPIRIYAHAETDEADVRARFHTNHVQADPVQALMQVLVETRQSKGVTQQKLADRLDRPQSYIAKVETGERRLDVIEFIEWAIALEAEPSSLIVAIDQRVKRRRSTTV